MENKKQEILSNIEKLEFRLGQVRTNIAGLGDMSSLLRSIKNSVNEALTTDDYEEAIVDQKRLVKQLDFIINGKDCAEQASLCDIVSQVKDIFGTKQKLSKKQIEDVVKDIMGLPSYLPTNSMAPTMKASFDLGVECILKGTNIIITTEQAEELPPLKFGDFCRAQCTAPARYMGHGKCLYVSSMTNELTIDSANPLGARENTSNLPVPSDKDLQEYYNEYLKNSINK